MQYLFYGFLLMLATACLGVGYMLAYSLINRG